MKKLLQLGFLPASSDLGLLVLRLWIGLSMLLLHGWGKAVNFSAMADKLPDPLGVGHRPSFALVVFAEVVCAALLAVGLFTRLAALILAIELGVAFALVHKFALSGPGSGELAFLYFAGAVTVLLAGGGRFSFDATTSSGKA